MCTVYPLTIETHQRGTVLYCEDMQGGQVIDDQLVIRNPFGARWRVMEPTPVYAAQA